MSSYINFYLRKKDTDVYTLLYSASRSHPIYQTFYEVMGSHLDQHDRCLPLTNADLTALHREAEKSVKIFTGLVEKAQKQIQDIATWNNSIDEKLEAVNELEARLESYREEIDWLNFTIDAFSMFICIADEQYNCPHPTLYAGIDGYNPGHFLDPNGNEDDE